MLPHRRLAGRRGGVALDEGVDMRKAPVLVLLLCLALGVMGAPGRAAVRPGAAQAPRPGFVTGPQEGSPRDIALRHLRSNARALGVSAADLAELQVTDAYRSGHTGVTHVYLRQRHGALDVLDTAATVNVADDGSIVSVQARLLPDLARAAAGRALRGPVEAAEAALAGVGLQPTRALRVLRSEVGPAQRTVLSEGGVAEGPLESRLVHQPVGGGRLRLAWLVEVAERSGDHVWQVVVDAATGAVLDTVDLVDHDDLGATAAALARPSDAAAASAGGADEQTAESSTSPGATPPGATSPDATPPAPSGPAYRVYAAPLESPNDGDRSLVVDPARGTPSPFGWHDTDGTEGAEFTTTRGNNVHAYTDHDGDGAPDAGGEPDGGPGLVFDFPADLAQHPHTFASAATTNLFFWNNVIHDVFHGYGFDEPAGNFQVSNYGRGGAGGDDVRAEAQDGGGLNNANFFTPAEGSRPRMQMYLWTHPRPNSLIIDAPSPAAGTHEATGATFGPAPTLAGISGALVLVDDGVPPASSDACEPLADFAAGDIAVIDRGGCAFVVKVRHAQAAGAAAVVVVNNVAGNPVTMGGDADDVIIPSIMVADSVGQAVKQVPRVPGRVAADPARSVRRDGDFDNGIIVHEYGHGISNRLTGGPSTTGCLSNQEQMGEGWSDWLALALTVRPGDDGAQARGMGTYAVFQPDRTGGGIRPTPYSTDMAINPATYDTIKSAAVPHGVGYVWATMLWDVYWELVTKHGFNPDPYGDWSSGGNNLAIQLVVDGMKLQVCRPGFVDGRDALLTADHVLTGGGNACLLWGAFARRGLGASASQGLSGSRLDGVQAFDLPAPCLAQIGADPGSISAAVVEGAAGTAEIGVTNAAAPDGEDLTFSVAEADDDCATPTDASWLAATPATGTTAAGGSTPVLLALDTADLVAPVAVSALVCLSSNDAATPVLPVPVSLQVRYPMSGFAGPIQAAPALNAARPGATVPVIFSLDGDRGMEVLADGSPTSRPVACDGLAPTGPAEPTGTPGGAGLSYDADTDRYTYPWRTLAAWAGTCRELAVSLDDGSTTVAYFSFR